MSRRKQAKPRSLKRSEWDDNSPDSEMGLPDCRSEISGCDKTSETSGDKGRRPVKESGANEDNEAGKPNQLYKCEGCGLCLDSLKLFMDHRNFDCATGREEETTGATHQGRRREEDEEASSLVVAMETENSVESDVTVREPSSWQSDTPDDQSLSPSSCATPTDPDLDLNYTVGVTEATPYACQFCDKAFPRLSYLKRHEQSHGDQMPFKCDFCHRLFKHKRSRDRHVKLHTGDKKYRCPHCDSAFSRSDHLKIHMKTHDNAKPFQCTICNRGYNTAAALTSHMQNHKKEMLSPLSFRCMHCTSMFQTAHQLQDHLTVHSSDSASPSLPEKTMQCFYCNHIANGPEALNLHIEQAHGEDKLKCPVCADTFHSAETMYQHLKVHKDVILGEMDTSDKRDIPSPRLTCMYCTKDSFTTLEALQLHVQTMHSSLLNGELSITSVGSSPVPRRSHTSPRPERRLPPTTASTTAAPNAGSSGRRSTPPSSSSDVHSSVAASEENHRHHQHHQQQQHNQHLNCEYCTMKFPSIQSLQKHTLSVHSFTDVLTSSSSCPDFVCCPHCTMAFGSTAALAEHVQYVHDYSSSAGAASANRNSGSPRESSSTATSAAGHPSSQMASPTKPSKSPRAINKFGAGGIRKSSSSSSTSSTASIRTGSPPTAANRNGSSGNRSGGVDASAKSNGVDGSQFAHPGTLLCNQCNAAFPDFESFRTHLKTHLDEVEQKFVCGECQSEFGTEEQLDAHTVGHFLSTTTEYGCQSCLKLFSKPDELQKHLMDIHAHHLYRCSLCKEVFDSKVSVQVHFAVKHSNECKLFKCNSCGSVFRSEVEFQLHVKVSHLHRSQPFRCLFCNFSYVSELELQCHLTTHKKQFSCTLCDEAFHVEFLLDRHMQGKHAAEVAGGTSGERSAGSPSGATTTITTAVGNSAATTVTVVVGNHNHKVKSKMAANAAVVDATLAAGGGGGGATGKLSASVTASSSTSIVVTKKEFKCDICDSEFLSEVALNSHRRQAHNMRISGSSQKSTQQILSLYCAYCNESCKSRTELENHMKVHTVSCGKHKCNICDEVCPTATILAEHKLTHCKVLSGSMCVTCKVNLKSEDQYYSHLQQHNNQGLPLPCVVCRQTLMSEIEVQMHVKFHLKNAEPLYPCCICLKQFEMMNLIPNGLDGGTQTYICKECFHCRASVAGSFEPEVAVTRCGDCNVKFETGAELDKHRAVHKKTYQCIKCQMSFDTESEIQLHVASHMLHEGTSHECRLCHKVFDSPAKLQCHLIEHTFEGCSSYSCYMCSAVFTTANLLQQHMLEHGLNSRPYDCSQCHQKFFFRAELENHLFNHCRMQEDLMMVMAAGGDADCLVNVTSSMMYLGGGGSGKSGGSRTGSVDRRLGGEGRSTLAGRRRSGSDTGNGDVDALQQHPSRPPSGHDLDEHQCGDCFRTFTNSATLSTHRKIHHQHKNPIKCTACPDLFTNTADMQHHYFRVHGAAGRTTTTTTTATSASSKKVFRCSECDKEFPCLSNLQGHMRVHAAGGGAKYTCPECHKEFALARNLGIHLRSHSGEKPYECPVCRKRFARKENRKAHLKSHSGAKPFACPHCDKCFSRRCHAREHLRTHAAEATPQLPRVCAACSESLPSARELRRHLRDVHHKEFEFSCRVCGEPFDQEISLRRHIKRRHEASSEVVSDGEGGPTGPAVVGPSSPSLSSDSGAAGDLGELDNSECGSSVMESEGSRAETPLSITLDNPSTPSPTAEPMHCE